MLIGVLMKYENIGFMTTCSVLKCVVNVTVSAVTVCVAAFCLPEQLYA